MKYRNYKPENVFIGKFTHNADLLEELNAFCNEKGIKTGFVSIIGAVKSLKMGYYSQEDFKYSIIREKFFDNHFEILNCIGNISIKDDKSFAHMHITVGDAEGNSFGGHLMQGTKIFAGEFVIHSYSGEELVRTHDETTKLPLWDIQ